MVFQDKNISFGGTAYLERLKEPEKELWKEQDKELWKEPQKEL